MAVGAKWPGSSILEMADLEISLEFAQCGAKKQKSSSEC